MKHLHGHGIAYGIALVLLAGLNSLAADAAVYKCKSASGAITYSQTPCPSNENTVRVTGSRSKPAAVDCWYANKLALETARDMQAGVDSSQLFDQYGGLNALSKGTVSLINYVYSHRANDAVSAERIAGLAGARCQARALGDVSCEALPMGFTEKLGGCGAAQPEQIAAASPPQRGGGSPQRRVVSNGSPTAIQAQAATERSKCRSKYQAQLDRIASEMRAGYTSKEGERYRERQRTLRKRLNDC